MSDQRLWNMYLSDRTSDLGSLVLEAQGHLLCHTPTELHKKYNNRLRKIISSIQDLRDEIPKWTDTHHNEHPPE